MTCSPDANFLATAIAVMILLLIPMALPIIRNIPGFNLSKVSSIGGGMALAAVFVFMVPDVMGKIHAVSAASSIEFLRQKPHLIFVVFATFLLAFCIMYALEKIALDSTKVNLKPSKIVFYIHMGVLCLSLVALVSSFPALSRASFYAIGIVCSLAVFEIFLEEVALLKHFGDLYSHVGRYIVMLAIIVGWVIGLKFINQETTVFTLLTQAFVVGMILTAVIKGEFDLINQSNNYITFIVSVFIKTLIVLGLILIEDSNKASKAAGKGEIYLSTAPHDQITQASQNLQHQSSAEQLAHQEGIHFNDNINTATQPKDTQYHPYVPSQVGQSPGDNTTFSQQH